MTDDVKEDKPNEYKPTEETDKPAEEAAGERPAKQPKTMLPQAPPSEWPLAWLMPDGECADQKAPNKRDPNVPVGVEELKELGIWYVLCLDMSCVPLLLTCTNHCSNTSACINPSVLHLNMQLLETRRQSLRIPRPLGPMGSQGYGRSPVGTVERR
jgi:hypothetical protein